MLVKILQHSYLQESFVIGGNIAIITSTLIIRKTRSSGFPPFLQKCAGYA